MHRDETVLYEEFQSARQRAMELTDRFRDCQADDPLRPQLWDAVVCQTETARQLLERWLRGQPAAAIEPIAELGHTNAERNHLEALTPV
jgi:hypothetical protein